MGSRMRLKILRILTRIGELNVSEIARRVGGDHKTVKEHLKILEENGILQHKTYGRICLYRFNPNSPKAMAIQKFIEEWESLEKPHA
ncbi:MAG: winged helix-turn-helix domain-containing protein [Nitrososphaerota archaeon]|nr:winged helix-turn-helix domain-containing protein [Candidatus Bathyarchaeota archaeon]MDW8193519.1 winged helix-turn-helix domain-containing protein [Nitrososphaerota archaeon]